MPTTINGAVSLKWDGVSQEGVLDAAIDELNSLPTPLLAQRSVEEIEKYYQGHAYNQAACFELLRRALAEQSAEALGYVFQQYERQILSWVYQDRDFAQTGESADFFAMAAFESFYFTLRGPRFNGFSTVQALMSYLKRCVHTGIAKYLRDRWLCITTTLDGKADLLHTPDLGARLEAHDLWSRIVDLLPSAQDQLLVECVFGHGLKPREVSALYRDHWSRQRDVSVDLYRIRRILRADPVLASHSG